MNILHLHDEPWDSGIAHYAVTLAAGQARRGHRVSFWARVGAPAAACARAAGLQTREVGHPWLSLPFLRQAARRERVELINAHTGSSHSLGAALAAGTAARLVRTCADARLPRGHALARALARRTSAYICANSALAAHLRRSFPSARVALIPQGIAAPSPAALPADPVVGLLGRLDPVKGHETLLDAAALIRGRGLAVVLSFAGTGRLSQALAALAKAKLPDGAALLRGRVADPFAFIAGCRVGCVPSLGSEAVSRAALEWMSMGRPVVASAVGGLPDLVEHGVTGLLVKPGDSTALADALERLLRDRDLCERMGAAAGKRFQERFGLERFVSDTLDCYEGALRAGTGAAA